MTAALPASNRREIDPVRAGARLSPAAQTILAACALAAGVVTAFAPTVASLVRTWTTSSDYHHGAIALPLAIVLLACGGRMDWAHARPRTDAAGLGVIAAGVVALLFGRAAGVNLVEQGGFALTLAGVFVTAFGRGATAAAAPLLLIVGFMVPFGESLLPMLQSWSASVVHAMLASVGFTVMRDGLVLETDAGRFAIAEACAGLKFLLAAMMAAAAAAFLAFRSSVRRAAFLVVALVMALAANWLRAFVVIAGASLAEDGGRFANNHVVVGWLLYAALILGLVAIAKRFEEPRRVTASSAAVWRTPESAPLLSAGALVAAAAAWSAFVATPPHGAAGSDAAVAIRSAGWAPVGPLVLPTDIFGHADAVRAEAFLGGGDRVGVILARMAPDRPDAEVIGEATRSSLARLQPTDGGVTRRVNAFGVETQLIAGPAPRDRARAIVHVYALGDRLHADGLSQKLALAGARLAGRQPAGGVIVIFAEADDATAAEAALRRFLAAAELGSPHDGRS